MHDMYHNGTYVSLKYCFTDKFKGSIHFLIQLSEVQYNRCIHNTVYASNKYSKEKKDYYKTVSYGVNIKKRKRKQNICGHKTWTTEIMLENTTDGLLYIITNISDLSSEIKKRIYRLLMESQGAH